MLLASVAFYSVAGLLDMGLVLATVVANYLLSFWVIKDRRGLWVTVIVNLAILVFFKYRHFLMPELAAEVKDFYQGDILIPLGISFYIFQAIAYQADLSAKRTHHIKSFPQFALFILLFAQVIAGPILRANVLAPQVSRAFSGKLPQGRRFWMIGIGLCLLGLVKKVGIADSIAPYVDTIFVLGPGDVFTAWVGAILFSFQIYFDFSGYSDIAVGGGYLLGIRLPLNFRQPYLATNPREFWQRWHITLSTWIRDYIYIPLGGSRSGSAYRQALVVVFTMAVAGLWHGANWTFIAWGACWGLYLAFWRLAGEQLTKLGWVSYLFHLLVVVILWVFFRAINLEQSFTYIAAMFGTQAYGSYVVASSILDSLLISLGLLVLLASQWGEAWITNFKRLVSWRHLDRPMVWGIMIGLIIWLLIYPKSQTNPFIYFRF